MISFGIVCQKGTLRLPAFGAEDGADVERRRGHGSGVARGLPLVPRVVPQVHPLAVPPRPRRPRPRRREWPSLSLVGFLGSPFLGFFFRFFRFLCSFFFHWTKKRKALVWSTLTSFFSLVWGLEFNSSFTWFYWVLRSCTCNIGFLI